VRGIRKEDEVAISIFPCFFSSLIVFWAAINLVENHTNTCRKQSRGITCYFYEMKFMAFLLPPLLFCASLGEWEASLEALRVVFEGKELMRDRGRGGMSLRTTNKCHVKSRTL
jgi:hypothetical protein